MSKHTAGCSNMRCTYSTCRAAHAKLIDAAPALLAVVQGYGVLVQGVIDAWSGGDLAGAVNLLEDYRDNEASNAMFEAGIAS